MALSAGSYIARLWCAEAGGAIIKGTVIITT
jgi:hypothetical protein